MSSANSEQNTNGQPNSGGLINFLTDEFRNRKTTVLQMLTRSATIIFTILYIFSAFFGLNQYSFYQKVLISNAATCALRLHERLPSFQLNSVFLAQLMQEDSAHYLLFSIIFIYSYPVTLVLFPVSLFAFLHLSNYMSGLLDKSGYRRTKINELFLKVINKQTSILLTVSITEIMIMPTVVLMLFTGMGSLFTPIIYYRFLKSRYVSIRNPYTRQTFHLLRLQAEQITRNPSVPVFLKKIILSSINFITKLAPPTANTS